MTLMIINLYWLSFMSFDLHLTRQFCYTGWLIIRQELQKKKNWNSFKTYVKRKFFSHGQKKINFFVILILFLRWNPFISINGCYLYSSGYTINLFFNPFQNHYFLGNKSQLLPSSFFDNERESGYKNNNKQYKYQISRLWH